MRWSRQPHASDEAVAAGPAAGVWQDLTVASALVTRAQVAALPAVAVEAPGEPR